MSSAEATTGATADQRRIAAIDESGWGDAFHLRQMHNAAFWLYAVTVVIGAFHFASEAFDASRTLMPTVVLNTIFWGLYTLPWIWFINHKDRFGWASGKVAATGFVWGGLVATFVMALPGNAALLSIFSKLTNSDTASAWGPAIVAPLVEESSKGVGVVMLILLARRHVRTSYDGFIYGAFVGLGFQVFEDWMYGIGTAASAFGFDQGANAVQNLVGRGLFAGLVSHSLYTAIFGAGIGWWVQTRGQSMSTRLPRTVLAIAAAMLIHGIWDYAAFSGFRAAGFLTAIFAIVLVVAIGRSTYRQVRPWMRDLLAPEVDAGLVTDDEITAMVGSPRDRRHYVRGVAAESGKAAGKAARHVLDAELDLADALAASKGDADAPEVADARSELVRLRGVLDEELGASGAGS
jgi:RsiW-degrading membrane proteinase PrsW (M82 family)